MDINIEKEGIRITFSNIEQHMPIDRVASFVGGFVKQLSSGASSGECRAKAVANRGLRMAQFVENIGFKDASSARAALSSAENILYRYGFVTINDFCECTNTEKLPTIGDNWGWYTLSNARIYTEVSDGGTTCHIRVDGANYLG